MLSTVVFRYLYVTYMLKGPTVIGFNCCGVPAIRHLYSFLYLYCMHVIRVILPGEVK
jgi:hypothetical protein